MRQGITEPTGLRFFFFFFTLQEKNQMKIIDLIHREHMGEKSIVFPVIRYHNVYVPSCKTEDLSKSRDYVFETPVVKF